MIIVGPGTLHWVRNIGSNENDHSVHISWNISYLEIIDVIFIIIKIRFNR